jgi:hypothetical protein
MRLGVALLVLIQGCCCSTANALDILVLDPAGRPLSAVVVVVKKLAATAQTASPAN